MNKADKDKVIAALEAMASGLEWFRDMYPKEVNEDDHVMIAEKDEALSIMRGLEDAEPVGWKLVPIEPTNEMLDAGYCVVEDTKGVIKATYRAMCAAAPIYMAKTKHGESCHFGSKSTAVAWAGSAGLVSELKK